MTLTEFLLARIAEDEAVARAAIRDSLKDDGRWVTGEHAMYEERVEGIGITIYDEGGHNAEQAAHIARHDPARVLSECEAKRRILLEYTRWDETSAGERGPDYWAAPVEQIVEHLASAHSDHPDYRDEWKP